MRFTEVNLLAQSILSNPKQFSKDKSFFEDFDFWDNVYGDLQEVYAYELIIKSMTNRNIAILLPFFMRHSNINTVSNRVFTLLKSYPRKKIRNSILISLAHCKISIYQLQYICQQKLCVEAFATLLDIYLKEQCFSCVDLSKLLEDNVNYIFGIDFAKIEEELSISLDKRKVLYSYLSKG